MDGFVDSYDVGIVLENEKGERWIEKLENCSLSDFEVWYGNNTDHIVHVNMMLREEE